MYDFHMHSEHSFDSQAKMEDMVLSAIKRNKKVICFTDHIDLYFDSHRDLDFHKSSYFANIDEMKDRYAHKIDIRAGVELGLQSRIIDRYEEFMHASPFDFVIMSTHAVDDFDLHEDEFFQGLSGIEALEKYYKAVYDSIKEFKDFDVLGHLDYFDRYLIKRYEMPPYDDYQPMVEAILKLLIENGKGIELNTSGLRYGLDYAHPKVEILKLYKELGGEIITIGSDAHYPEDLGYGYEAAKNLLRDLDFNYIHIFKNRKSSPISIK
ncbi:MAG TPA: histidinol-phosphatase HisJ family protein [Tissierellaceae bacterium]|nr:histidinol-phosphatase HisJ family protein [Tissierellaceae bacterium]